MRLIAGFSLRGARRTIDVHLSCMTPLPGASLDSLLASRCRADGFAGFRRRGLAASCPLAIPSDQPAAWEEHAIRLSIPLP